MKKKGIMIALIAMVILLAGAVTAWAAGAPRNVLTKGGVAGKADDEVIAVAQEEEETARVGQFGSFTGTIEDIREFYDVDGITPVEGKYFVTVINDEDALAVFVVSEDTYVFENAALEEGAAFTGYYDANLPMILIYPPQYTAVVAVVGEFADGQALYVDAFDEELLSHDGELKLNISEDTRILLADGTEFAGDIGNRRLAITYTFATMSIPAQTSPELIVVLAE